jgi:hypothetical protein
MIAMEKTEFTPGPWHWHSCGEYHVLTNDTTAEPGEYPKGYVHTDGSAGGEYSSDIDVNGPDAKLIAAVPDLYAAAEKAYAYAKALKDAMEGGGIEYELEPTLEVVTDLRRALAKARGEATP